MDAVLSFVENVVKPISHINNDAICITFSLEEKLVNLFFGIGSEGGHFLPQQMQINHGTSSIFFRHHTFMRNI